MTTGSKKTLGQAIDEIVAAIEALEEGDRATAVRAACEHLGLTTLSPSVPAAGGGAGIESRVVPTTDAQASTGNVHDIRSFKDQKGPSSAIEMACVVAYYLESLAAAGERKTEIGAADLEKYFKQGGYPLPKRMPQVLVDARGAGYFDSAGHGKYKLNPVGHNLVVHKLPKKKSK